MLSILFLIDFSHGGWPAAPPIKLRLLNVVEFCTMGTLNSQFRPLIATCLRKDHCSLNKRLTTMIRAHARGSDISKDRINLQRAIDDSARERARRAECVPRINYPDLPIARKKKEISDALMSSQVLILCGETGSGKTTQLPKICLENGRGIAGMIGHTQPRRIAARTVAARIAEELGQTVGGLVGYKFRFQDQSKPETLVKLMTDGILLAEIQSDSRLESYDTIILDEAHERSLNIDFLLGYLKWLLPKRPDLKVIVTSATIDPQRFSRHFENAPIIEVSGRTYPVEIRYRGKSEGNDVEPDIDWIQEIVNATTELEQEGAGDILIFLSGEREIREVSEALRKLRRHDLEILPLYSRLSAKEQQRIFAPHDQRRIVLSTNVAETSLTVPGIRYVIDPGLARISRYSIRSKVQRLPIEKISQASANQRAGRCGRLGPGICIRLYSEDDFDARPTYTEPEILRTNLASVVLQMKSMNLGDISEFPFIEPPDDRMVRDGIKLLYELKALDERGTLTQIGWKLGRLPVDPRLGRMLIEAANENCLKELLAMTAFLSIQDPRERPAERAQIADQAHARYYAEDSDFMGFLNLWNDIVERKKELSRAKFRAYCRENFLSYIRVREWQDIHAQLMRLIKKELEFRVNQTDAGYDEIHRALLSGLISNIGFKHEQSEYLGARNLKFFIHPGSSLFKSRPKWVMAGEQVETSRVYARHVAKISPDWIEKMAAHLVKHENYDPHWQKKPARVAIFQRSLIYGVTIQNRRRIPYQRIDSKGAREIFIRSALVNQEYHCNAEFFQANQKLLNSLGYLQHKGRRVDLIANEDAIYDYFDQRVPTEVVDGNSFERWRRKIEKKTPNYLMLNTSDIAGANDHSIDNINYPDTMTIGHLTVKLEYRFEPNHADDGVTAIIPIHQLAQLSVEPFEWLVPGLLHEKILALIKSLPKSIRRNFVPAPEYADRFLQEVKIGQGSLYDALTQFLTSLNRLAFATGTWDDSGLADHLRMNFRVIDNTGGTLTHGRNLQALQEKLMMQSKTRFKSIAQQEMSKTGCKKWEFGDLPEQYRFIRDGAEIHGFPAIIDERDSVGMQLIETRPVAKLYHANGLARLFNFALRKQLKSLKKMFELGEFQNLAYKRLVPHPIFQARENATETNLCDDLVHMTINSVFINGYPDIRTEEQFNQRLNDRKSSLVTTANTVSNTAKTILELYSEISAKLISLDDDVLIKKDVLEQVNLLLFAGFFARTPFIRVVEYPRYLRAILIRLEKTQYDSIKHQKQYSELQPIWIRYWESVRGSPNLSSHAVNDDEFRWSLEEFRVSLFAQSLKTAYPVSRKRLEKIWQTRQ